VTKLTLSSGTFSATTVRRYNAPEICWLRTLLVRKPEAVVMDFPLIASILPDCSRTLELPGLIHGGGPMLLRYRLGFELRRADLAIMAAGVALVVLTAFSF
jgi:hypothetical protein